MVEVKVLVEGYATKTKDGWIASPSAVLIKDKGLNIIVDPGSNKKLLLKALAKEKLKIKDINLIFLTHYHLDHSINIRLFPDCAILDGNEINNDDKITGYSGKILRTNIKVIPTPGHAKEHSSLLVETKEGNVVIAGDLFWWRTNQKQRTDYDNLIKLDDPYVKNKDENEKSRKKILKVADYIIPSHGKMFKVR